MIETYVGGDKEQLLKQVCLVRDYYTERERRQTLGNDK